MTDPRIYIYRSKQTPMKSQDIKDEEEEIKRYILKNVSIRWRIQHPGRQYEAILSGLYSILTKDGDTVIGRKRMSTRVFKMQLFIQIFTTKKPNLFHILAESA